MFLHILKLHVFTALRYCSHLFYSICRIGSHDLFIYLFILFIYLLFLFFSVFNLYLLLFVRSFARLCPPYNSIGTRTPTTVMSCLTSLHCWTLTSPHSIWLKTAETLFRVKVKKKWLTYMYLFLCNPLERSRALILCARLCKGGLLYSKHPLKRNKTCSVHCPTLVRFRRVKCTNFMIFAMM